MLQLKIEGKDVQELYVNGVNMLLLLTQGGQNVFKTAPQTDTAAAPAAPIIEGEVVQPVQEAVPEENPPVIEPPVQNAARRRGRPAKSEAPPVIEAVADPVPQSPAADEDPLGLSDVKSEPAPDAHKPLTLDDMRDRVKAIINAHGPDGRGNTMPDCIAYVRKLFAPFGVKLAAELKPAQFDEFWSKSVAYLDGVAK